MTAPAPAPRSAPAGASAAADRSLPTGPQGPPVQRPPVQGPPPTRLEPARRLSPSPGQGRSWRVAVTVIAAVLAVLLLAALTAYSVVGWALGRGFSEVPATTGLGTPSSLVLTTEVADIRVVHSEQAQEVSVALVPAGATSLPAEGTEVRAEVDVAGGADEPVVGVRQPGANGPIPWEITHHDLLVEIPAGHVMDLDLTSDIGDVRAQGEFTALAATSNVGEILLTSISAPDGVQIRADVGDVELDLTDPVPAGVVVSGSVGDLDVRLAPDSTGDVSITTDVGDVTLEAPGTGRWSVDAGSELGDVRTEADLTDADGPISGTLTVRANVGDVTVTR